MKKITLNIIFMKKWVMETVSESENIGDYLSMTLRGRINILDGKLVSIFNIPNSKKFCWLLLDSKNKLLSLEDKLPKKIVLLGVNLDILKFLLKEYQDNEEILKIGEYLEREYSVSFMEEEIDKIKEEPKKEEKENTKEKKKKEDLELKPETVENVVMEAVVQEQKEEKKEEKEPEEKGPEKKEAIASEPLRMSAGIGEEKEEKENTKEKKKKEDLDEKEPKREEENKLDEKPKKEEIKEEEKKGEKPEEVPEEKLDENKEEEKIEELKEEVQEDVEENKDTPQEGEEQQTQEEEKPKEEIKENPKEEETPKKEEKKEKEKEEKPKEEEKHQKEEKKEEKKEEPKKKDKDKDKKKDKDKDSNKEKDKKQESKKDEKKKDEKISGDKPKEVKIILKTDENGNPDNVIVVASEETINENSKQKEQQKVTYTIVSNDGAVLYNQTIMNDTPMTVLDILLKTGAQVSLKDSQWGKFVYAINGISNNDDFGWVYKINGNLVMTSLDKCVIKPGDVVTWSYVKYENEFGTGEEKQEEQKENSGKHM